MAGSEDSFLSSNVRMRPREKTHLSAPTNAYSRDIAVALLVLCCGPESTSSLAFTARSISMIAIHWPARCSTKTTLPPMISATAAGGRSRCYPKNRVFHSCQRRHPSENGCGGTYVVENTRATSNLDRASAALITSSSVKFSILTICIGRVTYPR